MTFPHAFTAAPVPVPSAVPVKEHPVPNTTYTLARLPYDQRHWPIHYTNTEGTVGCKAYPINYDELYNLKGRLLTLIDATFTDPEQRKAHKDIVWQTLRSWMESIEAGDGTAPSVDQQIDGAA